MEGTSTLADALLDDLDDLSDAPEEVEEKPVDEPNDQEEEDAAASSSASGCFDWWPRHQKRFLDNPALHKHIERIRKRITSEGTEAAAAGSTKEDDHELLVKSNQYLLLAANDLATAHDALCTAYKPKFPELEELIPSATQYVQCVRNIGNETDLTSKTVNDSLNLFLSNQQIMTLSVSSSTTEGRQLTDTELQRVDAIATYMENVMQIQSTLTEYIAQQMEGLAPSVCALIGPSVAAKLLSLTGGLPQLAKIPSCNLQVLGQVKHTANSRAALLTQQQQQPHQGILMESDLIQRCPRHLRQKALKMVAAKLALAIRCDFVNVDTGRPRTAEAGRSFRQQIEKKFTQLQEPDKAPVLKALPKPDLTVKKRRGGKRMRRLKERYEETALMKQANTRAFSTQAGEYGDDAMGKTLGLLDTAEITAGGALRKNTAEKRKIKFANTRASRKKAAQMNAKASSANTSGMASSMVFTPVQGMELVNPDANKERVKEANRKWFADNSGFQSALPKKDS